LETTKPNGGGVLLRIEKVGESNFANIPSPCRSCLYWQTSGNYGEEMLKPEMDQKKREWFKNVARDFGSSIKIVYLNGVPIGSMQYAPVRFFPRTSEYASGPPSEDAVFIACLYITSKEARGKGFGTAMLKDLIVELKKRGFKVVETFARESSGDNPSGPMTLYLRQNFEVKNEKDDFPLLHLDL